MKIITKESDKKILIEKALISEYIDFDICVDLNNIKPNGQVIVVDKNVIADETVSYTGTLCICNKNTISVKEGYIQKVIKRSCYKTDKEYLRAVDSIVYNGKFDYTGEVITDDDIYYLGIFVDAELQSEKVEYINCKFM